MNQILRCCSLALAVMLVAFALPAAAQQKKPNIVVIMGDDIGIWNIGAYHRGHDVGPDAQPRQDRRRGHAVHRLLRRGELHGGTGELHYRRAADPHRHDHRRPGRRDHRHAGAGGDYCDGVEVDGLRHRPVRQEPPRRSQRVPAHGARVRRIHGLSLSPRCDGGSLPSELSAEAQEARWVRATWCIRSRPARTTPPWIRAGARSANRSSRTRASCVPSAWKPWTTKSATLR